MPPQTSSAAAPAPEAAPLLPRVALLGNPNTGKTTLFNRLCGLRAKTANFPGTTTDARFGRWLPSGSGEALEIVDLPGLYSLDLELPEARVCRRALTGEGLPRRPDAVVVVIDATNLERNLQLVAEVLRFRLPTVIALNMVDLAQRRGLTVDPRSLARELRCPVVPSIARRGEGTEELASAVLTALHDLPAPTAPPVEDTADIADWAEKVVAESVGGPRAVGSATDTITERLDLAFTHPVFGVGAFVAIMAGLFWTLFKLADVPMGLIEDSFAVLGGWLGELLPPGAVRELLTEGVVGGVAGTVVFLPQICLLFFLISLLEDTGYLARAAFVMDRLLSRFGLPGQAFVPLLSSHACAIPGILATRLIPDRRDRLATILVAPFMSCAARLPVYVLLTGLLFRDQPGRTALAFTGCYLLGGIAALVTAALFRRSLFPGRSRPMMLELPTDKLPSLRTALLHALDQGLAFLRKAGTVILAICIVMWWLSEYPRVSPLPEAEAMHSAAQQLPESNAQRAELEAQAERLELRHQRASSFAGRLGHTLEPVFAPLGYDWQLTVGVLTSFLAREVFVSTMAVLIGLSEPDDPDLEDPGVIDTIRSATRDDGTPLFTPASAASLLVFFVLAMQCLPTLAVTRREAGGLRWAALQLGYMTALAYGAALVTYHGLLWLGVG